MNTEHNRKTVSSTILIVTALLLILTFVLTGCTKEWSGAEVYLIDIFSVNGEWWCVRPDSSKPREKVVLYRIGNDGAETAVRTFKWGGQPYYFQDDQIFYFIENDRLFKLDPTDCSEKEICRLDKKSKQIDMITEHFIMIRKQDNSLYLVQEDAQAQSQSGTGFQTISSQNVRPTGGTKGDSVVMWDDNAGNLILYDCSLDESRVIYKEDADVYGSFHTCIAGDILYMFNSSNGSLKTIDLNMDADAQKDTSIPVDAASHLQVLGMITVEDGLLCGVRAAGNNTDHYAVDFYYISSDGTLEKAGSWAEAGYYLDGSVKLAVDGDKFACCVTTNPEIYISTSGE